MTSKLPWRRASVPSDLRERVPLMPGERILGWSRLPDGGWSVATGEALLIAAQGAGTDQQPLRLPWHLVSTGVWADGALDVVAAPVAGSPAERFHLEIEEHGLLAEAVRTLVTGSIAWSSRIADDTAAATFSARRGPDGELLWSVAFERGYDATDPALQRWADEQIQRLQEQTGL
jgi:hypothetical protein